MRSFHDSLERAGRDHAHLCPRIILGVRIGLAGVAALGLTESEDGKCLLAIVESDGCFADGVSAATGCRVGHRTLRVEDYGKVAATFAHVASGRAVRLAPALDARQKAVAWVPDERRHYFAQMRAYRDMPDEQLLTLADVQIATSISDLISRPGLRVNCAACGEEIINERELYVGGRVVCRACAGPAYYERAVPVPASPEFA